MYGIFTYIYHENSPFMQVNIPLPWMIWVYQNYLRILPYIILPNPHRWMTAKASLVPPPSPVRGRTPLQPELGRAQPHGGPGRWCRCRARHLNNLPGKPLDPWVQPLMAGQPTPPAIIRPYDQGLFTIGFP